MSDAEDIRWKQRFSNYQRALGQMREFINVRELNRLEEQGLVKSFEYTYELAWKTLKDFLEYQGMTGVIGSRDAFRKAFEEGIVLDGHLWMEMIQSRNKTSHTYNEQTAKEIVSSIKNDYFAAFCGLEKALTERF